MAVPKAGEVLKIRALGKAPALLDGPVKSVSLLGGKTDLRWKQEDDALVVPYPDAADFPFAVVFRIE